MIKKFFENVVNHIGEPIFVLDSEGSIIYLNTYLIQHGIMTEKETLALNSNELFLTGGTDINIFQMVKKQKCQVTAVQKITYRNISKRYLVTQTPIINENGEVEIVVGVIRDIDLFNENLKKAEQSKDKLYPNNFLKNPFKTSKKERPIYQSRRMEELFNCADSIASSDATVLILGESGVGKEVLANYIHQHSNRNSREMITINSATLTDNLLESELFGYEKGSFTGALDNGKEGLIELADKGTLFIDEIEAMPLNIQAKFLRVLETHEIRPLGSKHSKKVDFRVIVASNRDLHEMVKDGLFREDLYYRLNVLPLIIPPLRERKEDIVPLSKHFLKQFEIKYGRKKSFSVRAYDKIISYDWPGNVRELRNFIERMVLMTNISITEIEDISNALLERNIKTDNISEAYYGNSQDGELKSKYSCEFKEGIPLKLQVRSVERELICQAVEMYGSLSKAADKIGLTKNTLIRKRKY